MTGEKAEHGQAGNNEKRRLVSATEQCVASQQNQKKQSDCDQPRSIAGGQELTNVIKPAPGKEFAKHDRCNGQDGCTDQMGRASQPGQMNDAVLGGLRADHLFISQGIVRGMVNQGALRMS
ncbi:hypothetical protein [Peteryoungia desertarenae]|uniref:hypothetical protein n=1 Tax=Peteryoungia desertarenae TaxID=1813451 RepID=UPI001FEB2D8E|nr:hypothetical protein [Peteryoungia desertarenae]